MLFVPFLFCSSIVTKRSFNIDVDSIDDSSVRFITGILWKKISNFDLFTIDDTLDHWWMDLVQMDTKKKWWIAHKMQLTKKNLIIVIIFIDDSSRTVDIIKQNTQPSNHRRASLLSKHCKASWWNYLWLFAGSLNKHSIYDGWTFISLNWIVSVYYIS